MRDVLLAPLRNGVCVLAEHALARAGRIDEHFVKIRGQPGGEGCGVRTDDGAVGNAQPLDVLREDARAVVDVLVGDEHALSPHRARELRRLAAGRGAQIEHPFPRLRAQKGRGAHGGGLLRIKEPRVVRGQRAHFLQVAIETVFLPRDTVADGQDLRKLRRGEL